MSSRLRALVAGLCCVMLGSFGPGCSHMPARGEPTEDDCAGARSQRTVGTVTALTGGAAMVTGAALIATAPKHSSSLAIEVDGSQVGGLAAILGGVVLVVVGGVIATAPSTAISRCQAADECRSGLIDACNLLNEPRP